MSFTFDPKHMSDDLNALSRGASDFLASQSVGRLRRLGTDLVNAIANARTSRDAKFRWKTEDDAPIQIRESKAWKGGTGNFDPMAADIRVDYTCHYLPAEERVQAEGVTVITVRDVGGRGEKVVHFDAEKGGWSERRQDGTFAERAGHPPFHAQFHGIVNDIPRLPSLIVHPVDVINLAILELHQKRWREHVVRFEMKSQLRLFPPRQRKRLDAMLASWRQTIGDATLHPLVAMQRSLAIPLSL